MSTEAVREFYAGINRNDIPAAVKAFDPEVEWTEPEDFPGGGTYRGLAVVEAHFAKARASWAEGSCEPERLLVAGDKVIAFVHVHVRLKAETEWREGRLADVYTFRNGKVVQARVFADVKEGLAWAGVQDSDAD